MKKARVEKEGKVIFADAKITHTAWDRMRGLLPRTSLAPEEALWITPCTSIHMFFMRFAIDAAFLDGQGKVIAIYKNLRPWRLSGIHFRAAGVLETPAGALTKLGVKKGEVLTICPIS